MTTWLSENDNQGLKAIDAVELSWYVRGESVWGDFSYDVREVNRQAKAALAKKVAEFAGGQRRDSLGLPVLGQGGAGKTHILSDLRKMAFEKGGYFIMVDMTSVKDFWCTLAYEATRSLDRPGFDGQVQWVSLIQRLAGLSGVDGLNDDPEAFFDSARPEDYVSVVDRIYRGLFAKPEYRVNAQDYQDLIRFLLLTRSSDPDIYNDGKFWYSTDKDMEDAG
ncbi:MAG: hypothetical protein LBU69_06950, partial [Deltaproteobacteria bacterium]|nr:hypothetical protein [Deltaproteobacteria bacterium]